MELTDYLRIVRRRAWILILLPLLAAGGVAALILQQPVKYTAKATVAAPALVGGVGANQYTGADGPKAFDANFAAVLTTPVIVNQVAQQTHVAAGKIKSGLSAAPLGSSSLGTSTILQVAYSTTKKKTAAAVAENASADTLQYLFHTQADLAQSNLANAETGLTAAESALTTFQTQTGLAEPDHVYDLLQQQINGLQEQQLQDEASGNSAAAAGLNAAISAKQTQLNALAPQVQQYLGLVDRKNAAITTLNNVQQSAYQAQNQLRSADPASTISVTRPERVSRISDLVLKAGPAGAVGVFLAVALVFLLELLSRRSPAVGLATEEPAAVMASPPPTTVEPSPTLAMDAAAATTAAAAMTGPPATLGSSRAPSNGQSETSLSRADIEPPSPETTETIAISTSFEAAAQEPVTADEPVATEEPPAVEELATNEPAINDEPAATVVPRAPATVEPSPAVALHAATPAIRRWVRDTLAATDSNQAPGNGESQGLPSSGGLEPEPLDTADTIDLTSSSAIASDGSAAGNGAEDHKPDATGKMPHDHRNNLSDWIESRGRRPE